MNPSDLIPITGAYGHRVSPPRVAGYEGVGIVMSAEEGATNLIGRRVLPLRGGGTWQRYVDCDSAWAVPVPDEIDTSIAARAYINPLAALLMLKQWPATGKRILLTGAGSSCAKILAQWAADAGAAQIIGIHRSPDHKRGLVDLGVIPVARDHADVRHAAACSDIVFDAVGGPLATSIHESMHSDAQFVTYGLLSGEPMSLVHLRPLPQRFHLRDRLADIDPTTWQSWFRELWPGLRTAIHPDLALFAIADWRSALAHFQRPGRLSKTALEMQCAT